ncbi:[Fe-Fe] hydrogenase large subunit C-terminal domain-containing protein [Alkalibacter mobilis]|uniref:[Fe-Fe] hydrogenase large subunit C-terminal domain-containing protein n=1 Tax=Alkalibacter mobilis TaxID=2787712 RepID=UPI00189F91B8|nr:[Fe-Fe] hydrogenase large subunit C-terminal domain-containing protein [Alkalibacter mobilis]MBF7097832.1 4Fe-4S binding protein [Alkalibacter mobilis]
MSKHSVYLDEEKCNGCTTCLRHCPTEACRIRDGKAVIISDRCIDCGECIRVCPNGARKAVTDTVDILKKYKYKVAIPSPTLISQFKTEFSINRILSALKSIGFDEVQEMAYGAEILGEAIKYELRNANVQKPLISTACPAVVRMIQVRFPELVNNLMTLDLPMEITARIVRKRLTEVVHMKDEDIGIIFITPCAAKTTTIHHYISWDNSKSSVDAAIAISDIYPDILHRLKCIKEEELQHSTSRGLQWAQSGGESSFISDKQIISVDGIHNVIDVLDEIEGGRLPELDFFEGMSCIGGCVGGCFTVENAYIAKKRIYDRARENINSKNDITDEMIRYYYESGFLDRYEEIKPMPEKPIHKDFKKAIKMMDDISKVEKALPGINCGSCGSPNCKAFAEDVVRGFAKEEDCIFVMREAIKNLRNNMDLSDKSCWLWKE